MMDHEEKITKEMGVLLMTELLGVIEAWTIDECDPQFRIFINIPFLTQLFEEHLNMVTQLKNVAERDEERNN